MSQKLFPSSLLQYIQFALKPKKKKGGKGSGNASIIYKIADVYYDREGNIISIDKHIKTSDNQSAKATTLLIHAKKPF